MFCLRSSTPSFASSPGVKMFPFKLFKLFKLFKRLIVNAVIVNAVIVNAVIVS